MVSGPVGILDAANRERPEAVRVAGGKDAVAGHHHDGEGAVDLAERVCNGIDKAPGGGVGDQLDDDFGVGGGLEVSSVSFQARAHIAQIDQIAVVRDGDQTLGRVHADGLGIEQRRVAGRRVARVADSH